MLSEFRLPALGADMEEGTVVQWNVAPGDAVKRGQVVAVVETDKGAIDVEIFEDGVVRELVVAARHEGAGGDGAGAARDAARASHVQGPAPLAAAPAPEPAAWWRLCSVSRMRVSQVASGSPPRDPGFRPRHGSVRASSAWTSRR